MSTEAQPATSAPVVEKDAKNVENPRKVFAGNLAFSTTEAEVKEMFSVAGTVTDVSLITRGTRSLGYGFVTFSSEAEAKKAAELLNKKEVGGREINVETARPQNSASGANGSKKKSNNKKKAAGPRARRPRNEQGEEGGETAAESATEGAAPATGATKSAKRRNKKAAAKKEVAEAADEAAAAGVEGGDAPKGTKKPFVKKPPRAKTAPTGEPSKTTLFVSNLSWSIDDEKLNAIFAAYKVKSATVIKQKYGLQRSKGFGFVDFESEEEQQKALTNEQGKSHAEREIHLRVALINDRKDEESKAAEETAANPAVEIPLAA